MTAAKKSVCKDPKEFHLDKSQISELIELGKFNQNDIFYDLGSGDGGIVIDVVKNTKVKKAIGIEIDEWYYEEARKKAIEQIHNKKDLKRIDFWRGYYDLTDTVDDKEYVFNYKDATVAFASLVEDDDDVNFYKHRLNWKKVRIIKKDMPMVGFKSVANRENPDCWFFLMKPPHKRITNQKEWIRSVSNDFDALDDLYDYYYGQWFRRCIKLGENETVANREATQHLLTLELLISERF